jgi:hypothetical protein
MHRQTPRPHAAWGHCRASSCIILLHRRPLLPFAQVRHDASGCIVSSLQPAAAIMHRLLPPARCRHHASLLPPARCRHHASSPPSSPPPPSCIAPFLQPATAIIMHRSLALACRRHHASSPSSSLLPPSCDACSSPLPPVYIARSLQPVAAIVRRLLACSSPLPPVYIACSLPPARCHHHASLARSLQPAAAIMHRLLTPLPRRHHHASSLLRIVMHHPLLPFFPVALFPLCVNACEYASPPLSFTFACRSQDALPLERMCRGK